MLVLERKEFMIDSAFKVLHEFIVKRHKVASHTERNLKKNKHIKDFCEEARHFAVLPGRTGLYIHYDVSSWFKKPDGVMVNIERIAIYDNFAEYESSRLKALYSGKEADDLRSN